MQNDTPITDDTLNNESVIGDNFKLLILHKAFNEIFDEDKSEKKEEEEKK